MPVDKLRTYAHIGQLQAGKRGDERIRPGIQTGRNQVNNFDFTVFPGPCFEKLFLSGLDGA